jgi:hypothetical protein
MMVMLMQAVTMDIVGITIPTTTTHHHLLVEVNAWSLHVG